MKNSRRIIQILLILLPLIIGCTGFIYSGESLLDSLFKCVTMYVLNYGDSPSNILVEIARWLSPVATASAVVLLVESLNTRLINLLKSGQKDSIAIYGDNDKKEIISKKLKKRCVITDQKYVAAKNQILLWEEEKNFEFYRQYSDKLQNRNLYIRCDSLSSQSSLSYSSRVHLFSAEETASRIFWKENCLYKTSIQNNHHFKIVLIGFGKLGKELLTYGLQNNIFEKNQCIEYHIFGFADGFMEIHHQLSEMEDKIIFHDEPWYSALALLEESSQLLIVEQNNQLELVNSILLAALKPEITVFTNQEAAAPIFANQKRIHLFNWKQVGYSAENILSENLFNQAKRINLRYAHLYKGVSETDDNMQKEWDCLDTFTRYSNISSADYHQVRLLMLKQMNIKPESVDDTTLETLSNLEHIRWMRYHLLNNWRHGSFENGKYKDPVARVHKDLIEYSQLSEAEKEKDRANIRNLLTLNN